MALYLRRNDSPAEALELLHIAAEQDPNNLSLKEDIANAYAESGDVEQGISVLVEAADASPDQSLVWQMLARLSLNYDIRLDEIGLPAARQAVLLDDEDPISNLLLGRCYLQVGNTDMAERFMWQAVQLSPDYAEARYFLGLLFLNQGNQTAAQEQLNLAYQLAPTDSIGLQALQVLEQYFGGSQ
jgi:predicted Zn-dependent protease